MNNGQLKLLRRLSGKAPQLSALAMAMVYAAPSWAQTPQAQPEIGQGTNEEAEEIIVTATRRQERIQDVPLSMAVFDGEALQRKAAAKLDDVLVSLPNVSFSSGSSPRTTYVSIRGVQGSNDEAAVGLYIDNVYVGKRTAQSLDFLYPASVQVLRGPQGALYGKNTLGGVIAVDTRKPSFTEPTLLADLTLGNYDLGKASISASTPLSENLALLVAGRVSTRNGYFHNVATGRNLGRSYSYGFATTLSFEHENLRFDLSADYARDETDGQVQKTARFRDVFAMTAPALPPLPIGPTTIVPDRESYDVALDMPGGETRKVFGITGNLNLDLGGVTLRSTTAFRGYDDIYGADSDSTALPILFLDNNQRQRQYSQELTLLSRTGGKLDWIVGASYYRETFRLNSEIQDFSGRALGAKPLLLLGLTPFKINSFGNTRTDSYAAYGEATYHATDKFSIRLGLRYARDDRHIDKREVYTVRFGTPTEAPLGPPLIPALAPANPLTTSQSRSYDAWIPDLVLRYEFTPDISVYAKGSDSYRPGGFNDSATLSTAIEYRKEKARVYEIGLRTQFLDRRLTFNATGFWMDWKNLQVTVACSTGYCNSNSQARSNGVEFDATYRAGEHFQLGASAALLITAKFTTDTLLQVRDPVTGLVSGQNVNGVRLARAPRRSASAFAQYGLPISDTKNIVLRTDISYKSPELIVQGRPDFQSPAYTQVDLRASLEGKHFTVAVWAKNLLKDSFWTFGNSASFGEIYTLSDPRTFGLTLSTRW